MKSENKLGILFSIILLSFLALSPTFYNNLNSVNTLEDTSKYNLKSSDYWIFVDTTIVIDDTAPFSSGSINWSTAVAQPWCSGSGVFGDPYIIENLFMDGAESQASLWIMDSNAYFIIRNCTFTGGDERTGIELWSCNNGKVINNTFSNRHTGLKLVYCQDLTIFDNEFNDNYFGMYIDSGDQYNVSENSFMNDDTGILLGNDPSNSLIYANTLNENLYGIRFFNMFGENNNFSSNQMNGCGFYHYNWDDPSVWAKTTTIEPSNLVNSKPVYFYYNKLNLRSVNFSNAGQVILVKCNNSNIANLNLSYSTYGIGLFYCSNSTLTNINCSFNNYAGFLIRSSYNITLDGNLATYNHYDGIYLLYGNSYNLTNNQMVNCGLKLWAYKEDLYLNSIDSSNEVNNKPIYYFVNQSGLNPSNYPNAGQLFLVDCNNSLITNLDLSNTSQGIMAYYCYNNIYTDINFTFNYRGIYLEDCHNSTISEMYIKDCYYGIIFQDSNNNTITETVIKESIGAGFRIIGDDNRIIRNHITNNLDVGVYIKGENNRILDNNIFNNEDGIRLEDDFNTISRNNITGNDNYGISLGNQYNLISENNISDNKKYGIYIEAGMDNQIIGNLINNNNETGIYFDAVSNNHDVIGNDIKFNQRYGIQLSDNTNGNTIYNNNFTGNLYNAEDNGTVNVWDNGVIGNYWDDYLGGDADDDGTGDNPYSNIGGDTGTQDYYPIWDDGDDVAPSITIVSPSNNTVFIDNPTIELDIYDFYDIDSTWFTIEGITGNFTFSVSNCTIAQYIWNGLPQGEILITIYAKDDAGHIGSESIFVIKNTPPQPPIPGYNIIAIIGVGCLITLILIKRKIGKQ